MIGRDLQAGYLSRHSRALDRDDPAIARDQFWRSILLFALQIRALHTSRGGLANGPLGR